jgi:hypothetical protein
MCNPEHRKNNNIPSVIERLLNKVYTNETPKDESVLSSIEK